MRLYERAFLLVYTLLFTAVTFIMILIALGWAQPLDMIIRLAEAPYGRVMFGIVSFLLFVIGIRLLLLSLNRHSDQQTTVRETPHGKVKVSLIAIENLVKKTVRQIKGVKDVKAIVRVVEGKGVQVQIRIVIVPEIHVPNLSADIQQSVKEYIHDIVGIEVTDVLIVVENITIEGRSKID